MTILLEWNSIFVQFDNLFQGSPKVLCAVKSWAVNLELSDSVRPLPNPMSPRALSLQVSYFVSIFPYILLTIMLVRGATLEGSAKGVEFYINPDFSRLGDLKVSGPRALVASRILGSAVGSHWQQSEDESRWLRTELHQTHRTETARNQEPLRKIGRGTLFEGQGSLELLWLPVLLKTCGFFWLHAGVERRGDADLLLARSRDGRTDRDGELQQVQPQHLQVPAPHRSTKIVG